jgi:hypothetical protein
MKLIPDKIQGMFATMQLRKFHLPIACLKTKVVFYGCETRSLSLSNMNSRYVRTASIK